MLVLFQFRLVHGFVFRHGDYRTVAIYNVSQSEFIEALGELSAARTYTDAIPSCKNCIDTLDTWVLHGRCCNQRIPAAP
jgi:hypothetical protein